MLCEVGQQSGDEGNAGGTVIIMNIQTNQATGEKTFVHVSRTGRSYRGATAADVERKMLLAALHALKQTVDGGQTIEVRGQKSESVAVEMCARLYGGIVSFGDLTIEQMRELKTTFQDSLRFNQQTESAQRLEPLISEKQRKRIVRLGLYVLGPVYGKQWFWEKCKKWIVRLKDAKTVDLNSLTNQEAWYLIQRLERIEKRLAK